MIDSHCHLDLEPLCSNLESVITRAKQNNIHILHTICTRVSHFQNVYNISSLNENIFCSVGNHPLHLANEGIIEHEELLQYTKKKKVISIGETGLDYFYSESNKETQKRSFIEHIIVSQESSLPIVIHVRNSDRDVINILQKYMAQKKFSGVIHCFNASTALAQECLDMGFYISTAGIITFNSAKSIQKIFTKIPLERILIETDAPYLSPVPMRGKVNEPSYLKYTAGFVAKLLNITLEKFTNITTKNFFSLFNKITP